MQDVGWAAQHPPYKSTENTYILQAMTLLMTLVPNAPLKGPFILSYGYMFSKELVFVSDKSPR